VDATKQCYQKIHALFPQVTGISTKVVQALWHRLPVVTTKAGTQGLALTSSLSTKLPAVLDSPHFITAAPREPAAFRDAIQKVLQTKKANRAEPTAVRAGYVQSTFSAAALQEDVDMLLVEILKPKIP
jgi:hypothetical protein